MKSKRNIFALTILTCIIMSGWTWDKDIASSIIYEIPTISGEIDTDGKLTEQSWSDAFIIKEFYKTEGSSPTSINARVLAFYDGENLVLGFDLPAMVSENEPKTCFLSNELDLRRVANLTITIDPEHQHGVYYKFVIDPQGRRQDLRVDDESWTMPWKSGTTQKDGRLFAEVSIPVNKLSEQTLAGGFWGFNISFSETAGNETYHSTPMDIKTMDAENFGHLLFIGTLTNKQIGELRSSLPGIHKSKMENKLAENEALCGPILKEIPGELKDLKTGGELKGWDASYLPGYG